jgi:SAM-dependent methyltransferase
LLDRIKPIVHRTPVVGPLCREAARLYRSWRARGISRQETFAEIFRQNAWNGTDSVSGAGSDTLQTRRLIRELPALLREFEIGSLLDVPCGDFFWMRQVDLTGIQYVGGDIVPELVSRNKQYETANLAFGVIDLLSAQLPKSDLVLSRDCLVHLSHMDVFQALANICRSGSELLLTTTFPQHRRNRDICTGEWRTLNLELEPFRFPKPLRVLEEGCTEAGKYADKSLGLWRIADVKECLARRGSRYKGLRLGR